MTTSALRNIGALLFGFFVAALIGVYTARAAETRFGGVLYTWPSAHGVSGKLLATDGAQTLTWDGAAGVPSVPTGVVLYTTGSCPAGWADYGNVGEYFVAQASGLGDTYGTALSNLENRATGTHGHTTSSSLSVNVSAHDHSVNDPGHSHPGEDDFGSTELTNDGGGAALGEGDRNNRLAAANVAGNISVSSESSGVSVTGASATVSDSSGTAGTNAPYIQLRACRKS